MECTIIFYQLRHILVKFHFMYGYMFNKYIKVFMNSYIFITKLTNFYDGNHLYFHWCRPADRETKKYVHCQMETSQILSYNSNIHITIYCRWAELHRKKLKGSLIYIFPNTDTLHCCSRIVKQDKAVASVQRSHYMSLKYPPSYSGNAHGVYIHDHQQGHKGTT